MCALAAAWRERALQSRHFTILKARAYACKGDSPIKQTSLFNRHQRSGASWTEHYGWQVPSHFTSVKDEVGCVRCAAGISDLSWMLKVDLKGYGLKGAPAFGLGLSAWRLAPAHMLVTSDPSARETMMASLQGLRAVASDPSLPPPAYITEVTSVYAQFLLAGPRSRDILGKLTSLNISHGALPDLSCGRSSLAHVRAIVLRKDGGGMPAYHLLVSREYGESVWESLMHAGTEFKISPFGLQAQQLLKV